MTSQSAPANFSARNLRDALSRFATGVTIITARDTAGQPIGMTASSFNSVSMDPPLILWSATKTANSAGGFFAAQEFAVHVLSSDQTELSNKFASRGADKFADIDVGTALGSVPTLPGCAVRFDCRQWAVYEGGDHWIIVGEVVDITTNERDGLVFSDGVYATAAPLPRKASKPAEDSSSRIAVDDLLFYALSHAYHQMSEQFHDAVRASGLSVAEWRVLACLAGGERYTETSLATKAFLQPQSLRSIVQPLSDEGLCLIASEGAEEPIITGNDAGAERVAHLFDFARTQEGERFERLRSMSGEQLKTALNELRNPVASLDLA